MNPMLRYFVILLLLANPASAVIDFNDGGSHIVDDPAFGDGDSIAISNSTYVEFLDTGDMISIALFDDSQARLRAGSKVGEIHAVDTSQVWIHFTQGIGALPPADGTIVQSHLNSRYTIFDGIFGSFLSTETGEILIHDGRFTSLSQFVVTEDSMITIKGGTFSSGCSPCAWTIEDAGVIRLFADNVQIVPGQPLGFPASSSRITGTFGSGTPLDVVLEQGSIQVIAVVPSLGPWATATLIASLLAVCARARRRSFR
jgi:hypothetical protein